MERRGMNESVSEGIMGLSYVKPQEWKKVGGWWEKKEGTGEKLAQSSETSCLKLVLKIKNRKANLIKFA